MAYLFTHFHNDCFRGEPDQIQQSHKNRKQKFIGINNWNEHAIRIINHLESNEYKCESKISSRLSYEPKGVNFFCF